MLNYDALRHSLLIAMPHVKDLLFEKSVIYLLECSPEGAKGLIVNRPVKSKFGDLLQALGLPSEDERIAAHPMLLGGPESNGQGFILKRPVGLGGDHIKPILSLLTSRHDISTIADSHRLVDSLIILGCVVWGAGKLEEEIRNNIWLTVPFSSDAVFSILDEYSDTLNWNVRNTWYNAAARFGINLSHLSGEVGHA